MAQVAIHGPDEAISRAGLYKKAGADILFIEALRSKEDPQRTGRERMSFEDFTGIVGLEKRCQTITCGNKKPTGEVKMH